MGWATFRAIFSQTHLVILDATQIGINNYKQMLQHNMWSLCGMAGS
jgi:hypothetical protein